MRILTSTRPATSRGRLSATTPHEGGLVLRFDIRAVRALRAAACLVVLTACDRARIPSAPDLRVGGARADAILIDPDVYRWNAFDADVNITFSNNQSLASIAGAQSGVGYHVHKQLDASGQWVSDFDFGPLVPRVASSPGSLDPAPVAHIRGASGCRTPLVLDANGAAINAQSTLFAGPAISSGLVARAPVGSKPAMPSPQPCYSKGSLRGDASASIGGDASAARDWITRFLVTPANSRRLRARLLSELGTPLPERGHAHFTRERGTLKVDALLDDSTGALDELRVQDHGRLVATIHRSYRRQANGYYVLDHERVVASAGDSTTMTMEIAYRNFRLTRED
jgi:hypothetical protein